MTPRNRSKPRLGDELRHLRSLPAKRHPAAQPALGCNGDRIGGCKDTYRAKRRSATISCADLWHWSHIKNECPELRDEAVPYRLARCRVVREVRESRRLIGDFVLTKTTSRTDPLPHRVAF
jgi:hypothetical protein